MTPYIVQRNDAFRPACLCSRTKGGSLFQNREQATPLPKLPLIVFDPNGDPMSLPVGEVPPRVYPTNGINNDGSGNVALRNYLVSYGYPSDQVVVLPAIYSTDLAGKWND